MIDLTLHLGFIFLFFISESNVPTLTPYNKDGLEIVFSLHKSPDSNCLTVNVTAKNHTLSNMTDFLFQVAVPRVSTENEDFDLLNGGIKRIKLYFFFNEENGCYFVHF